MEKLCGCQEECFERGQCWGHFEGVMCQHMSEREIDGEIKSICYKTDEVVDCYTTEAQYNERKKWRKMTQILEEAIANMTPEEKEKFFPEDTKPKGWISIEDHLPMMMAMDIMQGYTIYKVKCADGAEVETRVSDHNTWYYHAKEVGITHWWNE